MTWQLSTKPKPQVIKLCNTCGTVIDTFDENHSVTKYMINVLNLNEASNLDTLDLGLQPYHWCPLKEDNHCLIPLTHSLKDDDKDKKAIIEEREKSLSLVDDRHAPFHDVKTQGKKQPNRGRPITTLTKLLSGTNRLQQEKKQPK